jgi:cyanophycin synthetase
MSQTIASQIGLQWKWLSAYHGPNPYTNSAVLIGQLMADGLIVMEPIKRAAAELWRHSGMHPTQSTEMPEGREDDALLWLGHTATVWALSALNEVRGFVQHAAAWREGDSIHLSIGFHHVQLSRDALQLALRSFVQLLKGEFVRESFRAELGQLWQACQRHHPDYQARILMVGARDMGVPYMPFLPGSKYWQFGWGSKARVFMESSSNQDGTLGQQWQKSKVTAKAVMRTLGLPTPAHVLVTREDQVEAALEQVGYPCVLKPLDSGSGKGVTANVRTLGGALIAYQVAHEQKKGPVLVEAHVQGEDHRLMVIDGQFVAAIRREPSFLMGDGQKTVEALLAELNANRSTNIVRSRYLRPIEKDDVLQRHLASQSITLNDVLQKGQRVNLRSNANLSTGGICTDVTAHCHPQVRAMAVLLAKSAGLATTGIDYLTTDITQPPAKTGGAFIEMNTTPGMGACVSAGWPEASIARLVLGESVGRIPVDITVLTSRGVQKLLTDVEQLRLSEDEALVIGEVVRVGEVSMRIMTGEPWAAVRGGLRNASVTSLHVICTMQELERWGCPVDVVRHITVAIGEDDGDKPISPEWFEVLNVCREERLDCINENEILDRFCVKKK